MLTISKLVEYAKINNNNGILKYYDKFNNNKQKQVKRLIENCQFEDIGDLAFLAVEVDSTIGPVLIKFYNSKICKDVEDYFLYTDEKSIVRNFDKLISVKLPNDANYENNYSSQFLSLIKEIAKRFNISVAFTRDDYLSIKGDVTILKNSQFDDARNIIESSKWYYICNP